MKILIHACPKRMWYVTDFLVPMLKEQGADSVLEWNEGNHFKDADLRTARAFAWVIQRLR